MTNTETAAANYARRGGNAEYGMQIIRDDIATYGATFGVIQATLLQNRMATVRTVERLALAILEEMTA